MVRNLYTIIYDLPIISGGYDSNSPSTSAYIQEGGMWAHMNIKKDIYSILENYYYVYFAQFL